MRIRKMLYPPTPLPSTNESELTSTDVPPKQKKMGPSSPATSANAPKGFDDKCFSVMEENRRITWSSCLMFKSPCRLIEEDRPHYDLQLTVHGGINGLRGSNIDKGNNRVLMSRQALKGRQDTKKSRLTPTSSKQIYNSNAEVSGKLVQPLPSLASVNKRCGEEKMIPLEKGRGRYKQIVKLMMKDKEKETLTKAKAERTRKSCSRKDHNEDENSKMKEERKRGKVSMESKECSRGNGRGWQQARRCLITKPPVAIGLEMDNEDGKNKG